LKKYICTICGYVYDESSGAKWDELPNDYKCPICGAPKSAFKQVEESPAKTISSPLDTENHNGIDNFTTLTAGEISAICSSLAKGCDKQRLLPERDAFNKIAEYFKAKAKPENSKAFQDIKKMVDYDLEINFASATEKAKSNSDRGALRSLVWSEKASTMCRVLLDRFNKEGEGLLKNTKIYVCDICGFIYIGDTPPEICPVCKVPKSKILEVERG
jgi:rubrerythrin